MKDGEVFYLVGVGFYVYEFLRMVMREASWVWGMISMNPWEDSVELVEEAG